MQDPLAELRREINSELRSIREELHKIERSSDRNLLTIILAAEILFFTVVITAISVAR